MAVLGRWQGRHATYMSCYKDRLGWQINTKGWRKAVERAGLGDFRWHDLRHAWASHHAQAGTPLNVLQEMGGWRSHERCCGTRTCQRGICWPAKRNSRLSAVKSL